jgi:hypothetical protein
MRFYAAGVGGNQECCGDPAAFEIAVKSWRMQVQIRVSGFAGFKGLGGGGCGEWMCCGSANCSRWRNFLVPILAVVWLGWGGGFVCWGFPGQRVIKG